MSYIIFGDLESLIKKIDGCASTPEKSLTDKIGEHVPCRYSMSKIHKIHKNTKYRKYNKKFKKIRKI